MLKVLYLLKCSGDFIRVLREQVSLWDLFNFCHQNSVILAYYRITNQWNLDTSQIFMFHQSSGSVNIFYSSYHPSVWLLNLQTNNNNYTPKSPIICRLLTAIISALVITGATLRTNSEYVLCNALGLGSSGSFSPSSFSSPSSLPSLISPLSLSAGFPSDALESFLLCFLPTNMKEKTKTKITYDISYPK